MNKNKNEEENDEAVIICKPTENNKENVRIFGKKFVKNNKNKCKIKFIGKEYELKEFFEDINHNYNHKDLIIFILKGIKNITDMSYMFADCSRLSFLSILSNNNFFKITESIKEKLYGNNSSMFISHESNFDSLNKNSEDNFYYEFNSLFTDELTTILQNSSDNKIKITDLLSKGGLSYSLINSKITKINHIFSGCNSLKSLPDISEWKMKILVI